MTQFPDRRIKTGGDPRLLADYATLREEISKLNHPARPDVNWLQAEKCCLALFDLNGVELQTAAWYTLARTHIAGLNGLNEGLSLLEALITHQWSILWPQAVHTRMEILSGLSQRLQRNFRTLPLLTREDLRLLYQVEKQLTLLRDTLSRHDLRSASQIEALYQQVQHGITRLENSPQQEPSNDHLVLPPQALASVVPSDDNAQNSRVFVVHADPALVVDVVHSRQVNSPSGFRKWVTFMAGAFSALLIGGMAQWGWQALHQPDQTVSLLAGSVRSLPETLSAEQIQQVRHSELAMQERDAWLKSAAAQLDRLSVLPPAWHWQYGQQMVMQAVTLWPDVPQAVELQKRWQKLVAESQLSPRSLDGWHQGMQQLQALSDKLNALDGQRGKYITVSELKSVVFGMANSFQQTVPVEEQLRLMAQLPQGDAQQATQLKQTEEHLNKLLMALTEAKKAAQVAQ